MIFQVWKGTARLWFAFWIMGVVVPVALAVSIFLLAIVLVKTGGDAGFGPLLFLIPLSLPVYAGLWLFNMVGIWRCAPNVTWRIWTLVARVVVVLMFLSPMALYGYIAFFDKTSDCHLHIPIDCPK